MKVMIECLSCYSIDVNEKEFISPTKYWSTCLSNGTKSNKIISVIDNARRFQKGCFERQPSPHQQKMEKSEGHLGQAGNNRGSKDKQPIGDSMPTSATGFQVARRARPAGPFEEVMVGEPRATERRKESVLIMDTHMKV